MPTEPEEQNGSDEIDPVEEKLFSFEDLNETLQKNVKNLEWSEPMPVQARVIPRIMDGKDVIVQSRTGSGKTGAFSMPLFMKLDPRRDEVQALILCPTRELAEQVHSVVTQLSKDTGLRTVAVYGGSAYGPQIEAFKNKVHIVVATPGRIIDHLESRRVSLKHLRYLVFDEADEMLSMGFHKSIIKILRYIPERRQTVLFSATIPPGVASLASRFTKDPEKISLSTDALHVEQVDHIYYVIDAMYKDRALLKLIEMENPEAALIFCNTKREVEYLGVFLKNFGYDGDFLSGDLSQKERDKVMKRIRLGHLRFLVATDVAARGIDISDLGYVILYNLPQAHDHYIHRAGRTGRAGESGVAISLVSPIEEPELKKRARHHQLNLVKKELPTDEALDKKVSQRLMVMLEEKYRNISNLEKERLERFMAITKELMENHETPEIIAMLLDQFYQDAIHKPLYPVEEREKVKAPPKDKGKGHSRSKNRGKSKGGRPRRSSGQRKRRPAKDKA